MKNLENYGGQTLDAREVRETDGGVFGLDDILVGLAIAAGAAIINDWDDFKDGLSTAFN
ncbi:MAG: hypothetical protein KDC47_07800 [Flavobacteriaceae bacterium]|nr:hypothetical protein [Flavobacteriaceae bacterium]